MRGAGPDRAALRLNGFGWDSPRWYAVGMQKSTVKKQRTPDMQHLHVVIRFLRKVALPRFGMDAQETFSVVVVGKHAQMVQNIMRRERFSFAGGQVLAEDVELAYLGPCSGDYMAAAGHDAVVFTATAERFALDFLVSQAKVPAAAGLAHLYTVEGLIPGPGHFGAGHWAQVLQAIGSEYAAVGDAPFVVHFAGGLPLAPLAQDADPLKIEGLTVRRKGIVEPLFALLPQKP